MEDYKKMYDELKQEFEQYKKESIKWTKNDFLNLNDEYIIYGKTLTEENSQLALEDMIRHHDADCGISWNDVYYYYQKYATDIE